MHMRRHFLGATQIEVSHLGFGCVGLTALPSRSDARRILDHAYAEGITHFDVARAYGFGRAEGILGEFLKGKRDKVTVATKFGLQPPSGLAGNRRVIDFAKKILRPFPRLLRRAQQRGGAMVQGGFFNPQAAITSLETSLHELGTDYVDLLLLHEANLADAENQELIETLQQQVKRGTVHQIGIASDFAKIEGHAFPPAYAVMQFDDNAAQRNLAKFQSRANSFITHSVFKPAHQLGQAITIQPEVARRYSPKVQGDLADSTILRSLLLLYALSANVNGCVLFASGNIAHIASNSRLADHSYDPQLISVFLQFVDEILPLASSQ
jgi:D-threo-aldose 1-dehydrogenase